MQKHLESWEKGKGEGMFILQISFFQNVITTLDLGG